MPKILYADHDYADLDLERALFTPAGIDIVVAQCKTEDDVVTHAKGCRAILLQYAPITARVVRAEFLALREREFVTAASAMGAGGDRKSTRLNSSHVSLSRMPSSA